jgi:hypothetical protein
VTRLRVGGARLFTASAPSRLRIGGAALSGPARTANRLRAGAIALSGAPAVLVTAPASREIGPGESVTLTATLTSGGTPDAWTWRRISGPVAVTLVGTGASRTVEGPSLMPPGASVVLGVTATVAGVTSPEQRVTLTVLPQLSWSLSPTGWVGSAVAPAKAPVAVEPVIRPFLIVYDNDPDVVALAKPGLTSRVSGPDVRVAQLNGFSQPVNGGDRDYGFANTLWTADTPSAVQWRTTVEAFHRRSLRNLWWGGADTAQRYNVAAYEQMRDGVFDARFRDLVYSLPIGTKGPGPKRPNDGTRPFAFLFPVMHEPDFYTDMSLPEHGSNGADATLTAYVKDTFKAGIQRVLRVMAEAAKEKGATPAEIGFGGCLAASDANGAADWRWWEGMDAATKASGFVVYFEDEYFFFNGSGTRQAFRSRMDARVADFTDEGGWGLIRPVLAETNLSRVVQNTTTPAGTDADTLAYLAEVVEWVVNGPGEGAAFFATATSPGSFFDSDATAAALGYALRDVNLAA